jgi:putative glutamine amidotransferase
LIALPLIGITVDSDFNHHRYSLNQAYVRGVLAAGGIPVLIPYITDGNMLNKLLTSLNGMILSGGGDPDPVLFNQELLLGCGEINPARDEFEIMLVKHCLQHHIPILGICRGCQVINIAAGGTIHQDIIPITNLQHRQQAPRWHPTHQVKLLNNSRLEEIFKKDILRVNSFHHQAIDQLAPGFISIAKTSDNIIEAIEMTTGYAIGVQWHPEELLQTNGIEIFISLVGAAHKV